MSGGSLGRADWKPCPHARLDVGQLNLDDARTNPFELGNRANDCACNLAGSSCDVLFINPDPNSLRARIDSGSVVIQGRSERGIVRLIASRDDAQDQRCIGHAARHRSDVVERLAQRENSMATYPPPRWLQTHDTVRG